jgi:hypothetical protein
MVFSDRMKLPVVKGMRKLMEQPDTITIEVVEADEINADNADLFVTIKGKSLFTGQEALKKAGEVRELVEGLTAFGLGEDEILIQSVQADVSTGVIGKQSSATYRLRIKCSKLDELADILGIITSQKNTSLGQIVWRYREYEEFKAKLLEQCLLRSRQKAENVGASLGVDLLGVHEFHEEVYDSEAGFIPQAVAASPMAGVRARSNIKEELGLSVSHAKRVTLKVRTRYRVSPFKTNS